MGVGVHAVFSSEVGVGAPAALAPGAVHARCRARRRRSRSVRGSWECVGAGRGQSEAGRGTRRARRSSAAQRRGVEPVQPLAARRSSTTSPASRSTRRCRLTAGRLISKRAAMSPAVMSARRAGHDPPANRVGDGGGHVHRQSVTMLLRVGKQVVIRVRGLRRTGARTRSVGGRSLGARGEGSGRPSAAPGPSCPVAPSASPPASPPPSLRPSLSRSPAGVAGRRRGQLVVEAGERPRPRSRLAGLERDRRDHQHHGRDQQRIAVVADPVTRSSMRRLERLADAAGSATAGSSCPPC